jgi:uncharacterized protein
MVTTLMFFGAIRRHVAFIFLFGFLAITFLLLAIGEFSGKVRVPPIPDYSYESMIFKLVEQVNVTKAGGGFGIVTAMIAYYCGVSELLVREESYFTLPLGVIPKRD